VVSLKRCLRKKLLDTHWIGLRAGQDAVEKRKICCPYRESNSSIPQLSNLYLVAVQLSYSGSCDEKVKHKKSFIL
jgi:hypothetical protein